MSKEKEVVQKALLFFPGIKEILADQFGPSSNGASTLYDEVRVAGGFEKVYEIRFPYKASRKNTIFLLVKVREYFQRLPNQDILIELGFASPDDVLANEFVALRRYHFKLTYRDQQLHAINLDQTYCGSSGAIFNLLFRTMKAVGNALQQLP